MTSQYLYSDKFTLSVADLTHIELSTDEDKAYNIDRWAWLFKSTTWEEFIAHERAVNNRMAKLTEENETLTSKTKH